MEAYESLIIHVIMIGK